MDCREIFIDNNLPETLSQEEFSKYIKEAQKGNLQARDKIINHNIKLVINHVLKRFSNATYDIKELISVGNIGLIKAVDTFDLTKGFQFSSYACKVIDSEIIKFMKSSQKYLEEKSLNQLIDSSCEDGLTIEDTIEDNSAYFDEKLFNFELLLEVRKQVEMLNDRDKKIIKLYFGFYNNKRYSQSEIAAMIGLTRSTIGKTINRIVNMIGKQLKKQGLIEKVGHSSKLSTKEESIIETKDIEETRGRKLKTIYQYFDKYTKEEIDEMLHSLPESDREIIAIKYGNDLDNPQRSEKMTKSLDKRFYDILVPKMRNLLEDSRNEKDRILQLERKQETSFLEIVKNSSKSKLSTSLSPNSGMTKEELASILELLKTPIFNQIIEHLSCKEAVIISLKMGFVNGKCFSTQEVADLLDIEETEVRETTQKILLEYKERINDFVDTTIKIVTDKPLMSLQRNKI